ncbi:MAG: phosphodiester glycosidase family protein [Pseudomonadota bacterium]
MRRADAMAMWRAGIVLAGLFTGSGIPAAAAHPACHEIARDGAGYTVCSFRADTDDIRLWHSDASGALLGSFRAVDALLRAEGARLGFAMNGGMYHQDRAPVGHYVESGESHVPLIETAGPGNFGLLPNGVFCLAAGRARILETTAFAAAAPDCTYATQSGPMLVVDGALHPRFIRDSASLHIRNGVGVAEDGVTVHFAISNDRVNFDAFGRLFRDALGTPNALYLDGKVSRLHAPEIGRSDLGWPMGPIIGVAIPLE